MLGDMWLMLCPETAAAASGAGAAVSAVAAVAAVLPSVVAVAAVAADTAIRATTTPLLLQCVFPLWRGLAMGSRRGGLERMGRR